MPVLGISVFGVACFAVGVGFMWWFQSREFERAEREIQQQRAINRRLTAALEQRTAGQR